MMRGSVLEAMTEATVIPQGTRAATDPSATNSGRQLLVQRDVFETGVGERTHRVVTGPDLLEKKASSCTALPCSSQMST